MQKASTGAKAHLFPQTAKALLCDEAAKVPVWHEVAEAPRFLEVAKALLCDEAANRPLCDEVTEALLFHPTFHRTVLAMLALSRVVAPRSSAKSGFPSFTTGS